MLIPRVCSILPPRRPIATSRVQLSRLSTSAMPSPGLSSPLDRNSSQNYNYLGIRVGLPRGPADPVVSPELRKLKYETWEEATGASCEMFRILRRICHKRDMNECLMRFGRLTTSKNLLRNSRGLVQQFLHKKLILNKDPVDIASTVRARELDGFLRLLHGEPVITDADFVLHDHPALDVGFQFATFFLFRYYLTRGNMDSEYPHLELLIDHELSKIGWKGIVTSLYNGSTSIRQLRCADTLEKEMFAYDWNEFQPQIERLVKELNVRVSKTSLRFFLSHCIGSMNTERRSGGYIRAEDFLDEFCFLVKQASVGLTPNLAQESIVILNHALGFLTNNQLSKFDQQDFDRIVTKLDASEKPRIVPLDMEIDLFRESRNRFGHVYVQSMTQTQAGFLYHNPDDDDVLDSAKQPIFDPVKVKLWNLVRGVSQSTYHLLQMRLFSHKLNYPSTKIALAYLRQDATSILKDDEQMFVPMLESMYEKLTWKLLSDAETICQQQKKSLRMHLDLALVHHDPSPLEPDEEKENGEAKKPWHRTSADTCVFFSNIPDEVDMQHTLRNIGTIKYLRFNANPFYEQRHGQRKKKRSIANRSAKNKKDKMKLIDNSNNNRHCQVEFNTPAEATKANHAAVRIFGILAKSGSRDKPDRRPIFSEPASTMTTLLLYDIPTFATVGEILDEILDAVKDEGKTKFVFSGPWHCRDLMIVDGTLELRLESYEQAQWVLSRFDESRAEALEAAKTAKAKEELNTTGLEASEATVAEEEEEEEEEEEKPSQLPFQMTWRFPYLK